MENWINKIHCGDALEVLKQIPDNFVDMVLTDPPFFVEQNLKKSHIKKGAWANSELQRVGFEWDKQWTGKNHFIAYMKQVYKELVRVIKEPGNLYTFCGDRFVSLFLNVLEDLGLKFKSIIIWYKTNSCPNWYKVNYNLSHEFCLFFQKGKKATFHYLDKHRMNNIIEIPILMGNERQGHPAQKPQKLIERLLSISSNEGDIILDCFSGSGTVPAVCEYSKRKWIGIDNNPKYCKLARKRLKNIQAQEILL